MCLPLPGKPKEHDSPEAGGDSFESSDSLLRSWSSQSSLLDVQRVPSFESFEEDCSQALCLSKPTMSFKDYIQERSDPVEQGKPVIPAAVLAGFTGECPRPVGLCCGCGTHRACPGLLTVPCGTPRLAGPQSHQDGEASMSGSGARGKIPGHTLCLGRVEREE